MTGSATGFDRGVIASAVLASLPAEAQHVVSRDRLMGEDNGHAFGGGWHVGWLWAPDADGVPRVEVLAQHRMTGSWLDRFSIGGKVEHLDAPSTMRIASQDPVEDTRLEREFVARQRQITDDLRARGLLPPVGENLAALEMNELLATDRTDPTDAAEGD